MAGFMLGIERGDSGVVAPAQPIYTYTWRLDELTGNGINDNSPLIYVKELSLPEFGVETEDVPGASIKYKYAKGITWNDVKITFYSTGGLLAALEDLKSKVWSPETGIQSAVEYKRTSGITQFYADDQTEAQSWTLNGSWIKGISHSNLTYTGSDVHNVIATVAYDWAESSPGNNSSGGDF